MDAQDKLDANLTANSSGVPMSSTEILEKAHDILAERGIHRGHMVDPQEGKSACSLGALSLAAGANVQLIPMYECDASFYDLGAVPVANHAVYSEATKRLHQAVAPRLIASFNDDPANSDEDILLAFKRAAHDE